MLEFFFSIVGLIFIILALIVCVVVLIGGFLFIWWILASILDHAASTIDSILDKLIKF